MLFLPWADHSPLHSINDNRFRSAVLHRTARIGPFRLAENLNASQMVTESVDANQRRIADAIQDPAAEADPVGGIVLSEFVNLCGFVDRQHCKASHPARS